MMISFYSLYQKIKEQQHKIGIKFRFYQNSGRILTFHQVDEKSNWILDEYALTFQSFQRLVEYLPKDGFSFTSLLDLENKSNRKSTGIALTFDDGFATLSEFVGPFLFEKNIPFAVFVTIEYLNKPLYLSTQQLKDLSKNDLCTVGAHSISHPLLRKLSETDSRNEIVESKKVLEDMLEKEVRYFAYPYGSIYAVSKRDVTLVQAAGFNLGLSTLKGYLSTSESENRWFLPRFNVNESNYRKIGSIA